MYVHVDSEIGCLRAALLASVENFELHLPINVTQNYYYSYAPPRLDILIKQQKMFIDVLKTFGVKIYLAKPRPDSPNQINIRDVATVVNDMLIICSMKETLRQNEPKAINSLIEILDSPIMQVNAGFVEGGDIILDADTLYVGISERTDYKGVEWLEENFGQRFKVQALQLNPHFLHLDVVFNIIGDNMSLIYSPAFKDSTLRILKKRYKFIEVTKDEQFTLATNVLSLSPNIVISNEIHKRINNILEEQGKDVIKIDYSEILKIGGAFRCNICPLIRD